MALEPRKLWVTRLKESTSIDVIRDTFSTNASKVLKVTMVSGGSACLVFASEDGKLYNLFKKTQFYILYNYYRSDYRFMLLL